MKKKTLIITTTISVILISMIGLFVYSKLFGQRPRLEITPFEGMLNQRLNEDALRETEIALEKQQKEKEETKQKERENKNIVDQSKYQAPTIKTITGTGVVLAGKDDIVTGEYLSEKEGEDDDWKISYIKGYKYIYRYNDLGIEIVINNRDKDFFYNPTQDLILLRNGNRVFTKDSNYDMIDYIEIFTKDPTKNFAQEINEKHISSGCKIDEFIDENNVYPELKGYKLIYIETSNGNLYSGNPDSQCITDKLNPTNRNIILFAMNPKHQDKYYKISISQGCAPGPCTDIESFKFF